VAYSLFLGSVSSLGCSWLGRSRLGRSSLSRCTWSKLLSQNLYHYSIQYLH
jgi:hypothetical protein